MAVRKMVRSNQTFPLVPAPQGGAQETVKQPNGGYPSLKLSRPLLRLPARSGGRK